MGNPFPERWDKPRPRLMATKEAIDRVVEAINKPGTGNAGKALKAEIIRKAGKAIGEPPLMDYGDKLKTTRKTLRRMQTLGMAWLLDKERKYADRARQELDAICKEPDWNPSHFLCTAEMTHAAAIGYDWFHGELSGPERDACAGAIVQKGLKPGLDRLSSTQKAWPTAVNNWNVVCNAGLMIGALAIADTEKEWTTKVFLRCLDSVPTGFCGYSPDGSWDEGPGYWSYATEYAAYLLSSLRSALGHEFGLAGLPGFRDTGFFRMHAEGSASGKETAWKLFNYSDCEEERTGSWCLRWLYLRFGEPLYNWVALRDAQATPMDLLWFSPDQPRDPDGIPRNAVFRGIANVAMLRGGWRDGAASFHPHRDDDRGDVYLAIRAGQNSRDGVHAHLDLGSFVLDAARLRWAVDLGPAEAKSEDFYSDYKLPGYFDVEHERRFRYYRTASIGHNTLLINGFNQAIDVQSEIVAFGERPQELVLVVIDLTSAYPDCLRVRRGFALINGCDVLVVDELTPKQRMNVVWQMHTPAKATRGRVSHLTQQGKEWFVRILQPDAIEFAVEPAQVRQPGEMPNADIVKLVATLPKVTRPERIAMYLSDDDVIPSPLPDPLNGPLWSWIAWAERPEHRVQKGESYYGRRKRRWKNSKATKRTPTR